MNAFHNTPRIVGGNTFAPKDVPKYWIGVGTFPMALMIIGLIITLGWCCILCCIRKKDPSSSHMFCRLLVIVFAASSIFCCVFGLAENTAAETAITTLVDSLGDLRTSVDDLMGTVNGTMGTVQELQMSVADLYNDLPQACQQAASNLGMIDTQPITDTIQKVQKNLAPVQQMMQLTSSFTGLLKYRWTITLVCLIVCIVGLSLVVLTIVTMFCTAAACCGNILMKVLGIICGIAIAFLWMTCGSEFFVLIVSSDYCQDPQQNLVDLLPEGQAKEILEFYITCQQDGDPRNPFKQQLDNATISITNATVNVNVLQKCPGLDQKGNDSIAKVKTGLKNMNGSVDEIRAAVACMKIHGPYQRGINEGVCKGFFEKLVGLWICTLLGVIMAKATLCFGTYVVEEQKRRKEYEEKKQAAGLSKEMEYKHLD
eukprot:TRINITY_DN55989_c0_g1_i1.p1 TRINITY_DN55989_c0_g1~~TRINITY_DN55989_c0_g1_i1.p1  ORF type:complete len:457 (-),score=16.75 TRINITY_DN55989_c0_g1_i1:375-1655(-)